MTTLTALDHVVLAVADLDRATDTYARMLGLEPSWRGTHPQLGTANTLFRLDNTYVELLAPRGDGPFADFLRARFADAGEGPLALAFASDDVRGAVTELRARGIAADEPAPCEGCDQASGAVRRWSSVILPPEATRAIPIILIEHRSPPDSLPRATPSATPSSVVNAVDHVVVMTGAPDAVIALYNGALGLRLALDRTFEERGLRLLFFRIAGLTVECASPLAAGAADAGTDKLWGVSYRVPDVAAARERIAAAGFDVSEVRKGMKPGTSVCTVRNETHGAATLFIGPAVD